MFTKFTATRWKIILVGILVAAGPFLGLFFFIYLNATQELERIAGAQQQAIAATAANILDEKLRGAVALANAYASRFKLIHGITTGDADEIRRHLQEIVETLQDTDQAFIASPSGVLLAAYPTDPTIIGKNFSQYDWYQGVSRNWTPYISELYQMDTGLKRNVFAIAIPVRSSTEQVIGLLVIQPKPVFAKNALANIKQNSGTTFLVDHTGAIIYHPRQSLGESASIPVSLLFKKAIKESGAYEKVVNPLSGKTVIRSYSPVLANDWTVVTESPLDEVLAPMEKVTRNIYIFTAIMLLVSALFAYRRSELIFALNKTSRDLTLEDTVNKAYSHILTLINREYNEAEKLIQAALQQLGSTASCMAGVAYLVKGQRLAPTAAMEVALPSQAGDLAREALRRNEMVSLRDIPADSFLSVSTALGTVPPREIIAIPLSVKNKTIAVLELASVNNFGLTDLRIINLIAPQLAIGINSIENNLELKQLSEKLRYSNEELLTMNEDLQEKQQELAEGNERLEQVSRAKSDFLANMSHELRTPLNSVIGFSEVLQDQLFGPINEKQHQYVANILSSGRHLLSLINDILDLSKVESGKMELDLSEIKVKELLDAALLMLMEKAMKGGMDLHLELEPEADLSIVADQRKLKQIMFNLLSNAVKFTPAGGSVVVRAKKDGGFIEISVTDTGIGIKEEDIQKLFHPFVQLESVYAKEYEGTGLGLALNRQLVELHGGRIWVASTFGVGSTFSFTIPISQIESPEIKTDLPIESNTPTSDSGPKSTVLVIEDDPLTLSAMEKILHSKGYRALRADNGQTGLEIAQRDNPDLIILDLMMPDMNGFEVANRLKNETTAANVPILVLTSMDLSTTDRARLEGKVWRIAGKGSLSTHEFLNLVEGAIGSHKNLKPQGE